MGALESVVWLLWFWADFQQPDFPYFLFNDLELLMFPRSSLRSLVSQSVQAEKKNEKFTDEAKVEV